MKVSDKVVQRLRLLIEKNNVQVGERLPAERQLCEQLGVSRSSLREAIQQLITAGIIQSKAGAGTYLKQLPAHWSQYQIVEPLSGLMDQDPEYRFDVQEARMARCNCSLRLGHIRVFHRIFPRQAQNGSESEP